MNGFEQTTVLELGGVTIFVVERTRIEHALHECGFVVVTSKRPDAVLVEDEKGTTLTFALPSEN